MGNDYHLLVTNRLIIEVGITKPATTRMIVR